MPYLVWALPSGAIIVSSLVSASNLVLTLVWTASLLVMGSACVANALRCGRVHCWFTGPFFLAMALACVLHGTGAVSLGPRGWDWLGGLTAGGGALLYFLPEMILGRHFGRAA
jgi:hypothetical protein